MPNQDSSNTSSSNPQKQPSPQSPMAPIPPQQHEMREHSTSCANKEKSKSIQLEEDIRSGERWLIGISAASVILNFVIALIYYGQLKEMRKSTAAAQEASVAASGANHIASVNLKLSERAWLSFKTGSTVLKDKAPILFPISFINSGRTPAQVRDGVINVAVLPKGTPIDLLYDNNQPHYYFQGSILFPNDPLDLPLFPAEERGKPEGVPIILTPQMRKAIDEGKEAVVVNGRVNYNDIFGEHHWIQFCMILRPGFAGNPDKSTIDCNVYNNIDR